MTILITSGFHEDWCAYVQGRMETMGASAPSESSQLGIGLSQFASRVCAQHQVSLNNPDSLKQIEPGKAWQISAADIILSNSEQDVWAWSDPRNVCFLDFWNDFDPQIRFVLTYSSPDHALAQSMHNGQAPENVDTYLSSWIRFHEEILSFYHAHPDRCLLVNLSHFEKAASEVTDQLNIHLGLNMRRLNTHEFLPGSPLLKLVARQVLQHEEAAERLLEDLECSAHLPGKSNGDATHLHHDALAEYLRLKTSEDEVAALAESNNRAKDKAAALAESLRRAEDEAVTHAQSLDRAGLDMDTARRDIARLEQEIKELQSRKPDGDAALEKELLVRQLQQVQEELKLYFTKYQALKASGPEAGPAATSIAAPATDYAPNKVEMDLRHYLNGQGWHHAEQHGRWAGEAPSSSIRLPNLSPGQYRVSIEVVDAMSPEILKGIRFQYAQQEIKPSLTILSHDKGRLAPARRMRAALANIQKPYPATLSATIKVAGGEANNPPTLVILSPQTISPASSGAPDTRELSICVRSLVVAKVS